MGYSREGKGRERHRSLRGEKGREIKAGGKKRRWGRQKRKIK